LINGYIMNQDMIDTVKTYVDYVRSHKAITFYEQKVSLESVIPDCYGTADCVMFQSTTMKVIDLKTGSGNRVEAKGNSQLMCYALGAYLSFEDIFEIENVTLCIVQPPMGVIDEWTISVKDLHAFAHALKQSYEAIQSQPTLYVASEKACKWCHAKLKCPEQRRMADEAAAADFEAITPEGVEYWLPKLPMIKAFIDAVENKAKETLLAGGTVQGYKVVEGRKSRSWEDAEAVESYLKGLGYDQIYTKPELLSPAQMEKALKDEAVELARFIKFKTGEPTIAKADDKRSSVDKSKVAAADFGEKA
jgi:hypothetical protein